MPDSEQPARSPQPRCTKAEAESRLAAVRRWIKREGISVDEAVERLQDAHGIGRRQALRYWVRGYKPLLSAQDRRRMGRPRDGQGRYTMWPSLQHADGGAAIGE